MRLLRLVSLAPLPFLWACAAPQPVLYQPPQMAAAQAQKLALDSRSCQAEASKQVGRSRANAFEPAARAGLIGFAAAAAASLATHSKEIGQRARGAAAGGAAGVATKTLLEWNSPDEVQEAYFEACMKDRGHQVLGWR